MFIYLQYDLGIESGHDIDAVFENLSLEPVGEIDYRDVQYAVLSDLRCQFTQSNSVRMWVSQCGGEQGRALWDALHRFIVEMWRDHEDFVGLMFMARDDGSPTEAVGCFVRNGVVVSFSGEVGSDLQLNFREHPPIVRVSLEDVERQREERERAEQEAERVQAEMVSEFDEVEWWKEGF